MTLEQLYQLTKNLNSFSNFTNFVQSMNEFGENLEVIHDSSITEISATHNINMVFSCIDYLYNQGAFGKISTRALSKYLEYILVQAEYVAPYSIAPERFGKFLKNIRQINFESSEKLDLTREILSNLGHVLLERCTPKAPHFLLSLADFLFFCRSAPHELLPDDVNVWIKRWFKELDNTFKTCDMKYYDLNVMTKAIKQGFDGIETYIQNFPHTEIDIFNENIPVLLRVIENKEMYRSDIDKAMIGFIESFNFILKNNHHKYDDIDVEDLLKIWEKLVTNKITPLIIFVERMITCFELLHMKNIISDGKFISILKQTHDQCFKASLFTMKYAEAYQNYVERLDQKIHSLIKNQNNITEFIDTPAPSEKDTQAPNDNVVIFNRVSKKRTFMSFFSPSNANESPVVEHSYSYEPDYITQILRAKLSNEKLKKYDVKTNILVMPAQTYDNYRGFIISKPSLEELKDLKQQLEQGSEIIIPIQIKNQWIGLRVYQSATESTIHVMSYELSDNYLHHTLLTRLIEQLFGRINVNVTAYNPGEFIKNNAKSIKSSGPYLVESIQQSILSLYLKPESADEDKIRRRHFALWKQEQDGSIGKYDLDMPQKCAKY